MSTRTEDGLPGPGPGTFGAKASSESASRERIFYLLAHISLRRDRMLQDILRAHDLTLTQWRVLYSLGKLKTRTMNEVADFLVLDRTGLTRAVDKLEERGLLDRAEVAHDRRLTELTLTAQGLATRAELLEQVSELSDRVTASVDEGRLGVAAEALEAILERLVGHRAGARRIIDLF